MVQPFVATVAFVEQQVIVAVADTMVVAMVVPPEVVPVFVLLALPLDQVVQQIEHVLEIVVAELPWLSVIVPLQCHLLVQFVLLRALLVQPVFELVGQLLEKPESPAIVELKQTMPSLGQYLVAAMVAGSVTPSPLPVLAGKTWVYSCPPHAFLPLVVVMRRRNPSFSCPWMIYVHPVFVWIVTFSPHQMSFVFDVGTSSLYETLTYDA